MQSRRAEIVLVPEAESARRARRFVRDVLRPVRHDIPLDSVLLVVSELVTNAVRHASGAPVLVVDAGPTRVRVEVRDREPSVPAPRPAEPDEESGRGLLIVAAVADEWGVEPDGSGKAIWAELAC
ncbi:MAG TPA: ATP-binding protein [Mycobacteriales bacterium]|nr:ATP-binding protein [Mycobacteriales bacterium]